MRFKIEVSGGEDLLTEVVNSEESYTTVSHVRTRMGMPKVAQKLKKAGSVVTKEECVTLAAKIRKEYEDGVKAGVVRPESWNSVTQSFWQLVLDFAKFLDLAASRICFRCRWKLTKVTRMLWRTGC